jgi:hypothetical protein
MYVCKGGPKKKQEEDGITEKIPRTFHEVCLLVIPGVNVMI